jgi:hypothetical protein
MFIKHHAMTIYGDDSWSRQLIEVSGQLHDPTALPQGKKLSELNEYEARWASLWK